MRGRVRRHSDHATKGALISTCVVGQLMRQRLTASCCLERMCASIRECRCIRLQKEMVARGCLGSSAELQCEGYSNNWERESMRIIGGKPFRAKRLCSCLWLVADHILRQVVWQQRGLPQSWLCLLGFWLSSQGFLFNRDPSAIDMIMTMFHNERTLKE